MRLELVTSVERLAELEPDWWELFRNAEASPFQSPAWLLPWLQAFTRDPALSTVAVHHQGKLQALLPLMALHYRGERLAGPIGMGLSDYLDVLVRRDANRATYDLITNGLREIASEVERISFEGVPHGSHLFDIARRSGRQVEAHGISSRLALGPSYLEYEASLPDAFKQELRRARADLEASGEVCIELADRASLDHALSALFALCTPQPEGDAVLADEMVRRFYRLAAPRLHSAGLLRLWLATRGERVVGAALILLGSSTACCYLTGQAKELGDSALSALLAARAIRDACELGKRSFDFLRDHQHKYDFLAEDAFTYRLSFSTAPHRSAVGAVS